jgi:DNA-binding protein HU-beta
VNKSQLIDAVAAQLADEAKKNDTTASPKKKKNTKAPSKADVTKVINAALDAVQGAVAKGDKVTVPGFGSFERRFREARTAPNPRGGAPVQVAAKHVPVFRPSDGFKDTVAAA